MPVEGKGRTGERECIFMSVGYPIVTFAMNPHQRCPFTPEANLLGVTASWIVCKRGFLDNLCRRSLVQREGWSVARFPLRCEDDLVMPGIRTIQVTAEQASSSILIDHFSPTMTVKSNVLTNVRFWPACRGRNDGLAAT